MVKKHKTMKQAQIACRKLRAKRDKASEIEANEIEKEWINHPDYESYNAYLLRKSGGR